ncbi:hypothetical protein [Atlantibacter hermannii]|uniref:Uncharacterized protein n=1 Tax=Atlantibacter hermannii NBRC 105704 TaxID=1115512 RepID=H5UWI5_ATLHE|nr:hypothetical protein [Atlantibacter hermannii]QPS90203.1 hypothetical protein I6G45_11570 [Atlantibacter hermannii]GAB50266.1 hypothetical protein EH105704_01_02730 [Atlantibacter hermannii NBRC 105704]
MSDEKLALGSVVTVKHFPDEWFVFSVIINNSSEMVTLYNPKSQDKIILPIQEASAAIDEVIKDP